MKNSTQYRQTCLPYGVWTLEDGSQVLFNRGYLPLWQSALRTDPSSLATTRRGKDFQTLAIRDG
jgi:hypothetical protein